MTIPPHPKLYHIVHVDRLASIVSDGFLWSDAEVVRRGAGGTTIGMSTIERVGVHSKAIYHQVMQTLMSSSSRHRPRVEVCKDWYY